MKVLLVNGSPCEKGCTYTALKEVAAALETSGIKTEIFQLGAKPISGCIACRKCRDLKKCVIDDVVNEFIEKAGEADGFIFGSPVHYAAVCGSMTSFLDRAFYAVRQSRQDEIFYLKPVACVVSARRAGTTSAFDQLNKYPTIAEMPVISARYWNMVHGNTPEEVLQDKEGLQIMRTLGRNMAWFLKCKEAGERNGVSLPEREEPIATNFVR